MGIVADGTPCRNGYADHSTTNMYRSGDETQSTRQSNHFSQKRNHNHEHDIHQPDQTSQEAQTHEANPAPPAKWTDADQGSYGHLLDSASLLGSCVNALYNAGAYAQRFTFMR